MIELFPVRYIGVHTGKDDILISNESEELKQRFKRYYDTATSDEEILEHDPRLMTPANRFNPKEIRKQLVGKFEASKATRYYYRPFDLRWLWYEDKTKLVQEKNFVFKQQVFESNKFLVSSQNIRRGYDGPMFSQVLVDLHPIESGAHSLPLKLRYKSEGLYDNDGSGEYKYLPNVPDFYDDLVRNRLLKLPKTKASCTPMPKPDPVLSRYTTVKDEAGEPTEEAFGVSEALFYHALAVMHAPAYREEHAEYLAEDWPRIPLLETLEALNASAELGKKVARLLDPLSEADDLLGPYKEFGKLSGDLSGDLRVGTKPTWKADALELSEELRLENVPGNVWAYTLGGYPVLSKWLGYRKDTILSTQDALWLGEIVGRIAALIDMGDMLNASYRKNSKA